MFELLASDSRFLENHFVEKRRFESWNCEKRFCFQDKAYGKLGSLRIAQAAFSGSGLSELRADVD